MSIDTDEDEHSIEMQLPYIAKAMERWETWSESQCFFPFIEIILVFDHILVKILNILFKILIQKHVKVKQL